MCLKVTAIESPNTTTCDDLMRDDKSTAPKQTNMKLEKTPDENGKTKQERDAANSQKSHMEKEKKKQDFPPSPDRREQNKPTLQKNLISSKDKAEREKEDRRRKLEEEFQTTKAGNNISV